jgi:hypothetical protein
MKRAVLCLGVRSALPVEREALVGDRDRTVNLRRLSQATSDWRNHCRKAVATGKRHPAEKVVQGPVDNKAPLAVVQRPPKPAGRYASRDLKEAAVAGCEEPAAEGSASD